MDNKIPYDPDSLAERLDEVLSTDSQTGVDGDPLIETAQRLQNAPKPQISPAAMAKIQGQLLEMTSSPPSPSWQVPRLPILGGVVTIVAIEVLTILSTSSPNDPNAQTLEPPEAAAPIEDVQAVEETPEPMVETTETPMETLLVIEGPVEVIDGAFVTIFGVVIDFGEDNPLLDVIQLGDTIRVTSAEGIDEELTVLIPADITFLEAEVFVDENTQAVYRDDGTNCNNPPPEWAPAQGWRERCGGGVSPGQNDKPGQGKGADKSK